MRRREFITLLGGAAVALLVAARGQQAKMPVIGILSEATALVGDKRMIAFREGLAGTGYIDGQNVLLRLAIATQGDRLPTLAADLVHRQVSVTTNAVCIFLTIASAIA